LSLRILFLGENWYGSCARACCYALRRLGCDVRDVDVQTFIPQLRRKSSRLILRALEPLLVREYNEHVLDCAAHFLPDFLLAFKGSLVLPKTLQKLRGQGITLYNYYPDTSAFAHGSRLPRSLVEYDCIFYTKHFWVADTQKSVHLKNAVYLPHGYDSELHRPLDLARKDVQQYRHDCVVVATFTPAKQDLLARLIRLRPGLDLRIWGNQWLDRCSIPELRPHITGTALEGDSYAKAVRAARINLAILSGKVHGSSQGDETTTRTYEIPACGGFMLHERTPELAELFEEGKEVACFGSVEELAQKVDYYLAHPEERDRIAAAGHRRCVPAYSYDERMRCLLAYHVGEIDTQSKNGCSVRAQTQCELDTENSLVR
jgi:spore maturation protein CgeB